MDLAERIANVVELTRERMGDEPARQVKQAVEMAEWFHAGQVRKLDGAPYVTHCLQVAAYCLTWGLTDPQAVCAALLHDALEDAPADMEAERRIGAFDPEVLEIVQALSKIRNLQTGDSEINATYRRILSSSAKDLRVILVKAFDVLNNSETYEVHTREKAKNKASIGLIYVGVARRLGIMALADTLIERLLPHLMPVQTRQALKNLHALQKEGAASMERMTRHLNPVLADGFAVDYVVEPKKLADYFLLTEQPGTGELRRVGWPVHRMRLMVESDDAAWRVLGRMHHLFGPMPRHVRDYLNAPRINGFRALTTRVLWEGRPVSVHVVNVRDDQPNRLGILAEWGVSGPDPNRYMRLLAILGDSDLRMSEIHSHVLPDMLDVYTPRGDRYTFPVEAIVVDFAYRIHTDLGERCIGARVNGIRRPPEHKLTDGDVIEVLVSKGARPQRAWLDLVKTARARTMIKLALKNQQIAVRGVERLRPGVFQLSILSVPDIQWSTCCLPTPGDPIVGRLSADGHWIVHRADCVNVQDSQQGQQWEPGEWALTGDNEILNVTFSIDHRNGALLPVLELLANRHITSHSIQGKGRSSETFIISVELGGKNPIVLGGILKELPKIWSVKEIKRYFWRI
ncbi:MAG: bifunctional (p)ppGpp synthetase/guanosine-3',5'-bis(diphosphate) 3'-pyrophosphohydrolase [Magnetococcales bacterium]|nr:bifunctional (p)ppGpp synthetase/guanosine-3',5'-bis(diphosphate) 3'-pyrophosphohydrolase [Magnetococcales bacterium]